MQRTRTRSSSVTAASGLYTTKSGTSQLGFSHHVTESTEDFTHDWPPRGPAGGDIGGPFKRTKSDIAYSSMRIDSRLVNSLGSWEYHGTVAADDVGPLTGHLLGSMASDSQILAIGATAISRTIPTQPAASVSTMLGEIFREGIPRAVGAATLKNKFRDYRDIGGEYLNVQFGWLPVVNDIRSVAKAISDSDRILGQLERDSGRNVRRKFAFPPQYQITQVTGSSGYNSYPILPNQVVFAAPQRTTTNSFERKDWFSGCFTFHFQLSDKQRSGLADQAKKARVLLGLELTPETVWNLTPWSWMADWVTNAGDVFSNVSRFANDDLAMRYGYMMSESTSMQTMTLHRCQSRNMSGILLPGRDLSVTRTLNSKRRLPATPFGFGLDTGAFSMRQWAILGALGISRGPNAR